jgi:hypothetical protein
MFPAYPRGVPFHGEFSSADASALTEANSRFTLYGGSSTSALTLTSNSLVQIADLVISVGASAITVTIYDGSDNVVGAGEKVLKVNAAINSGLAWTRQAPHYCQQGTGGIPYPKVITSAAGQVDVTISGFIYEMPGT